MGESVFEELVQNVQKGELYSVKLKDEPQELIAIPMIPGRLQNSIPPKFILNVISPEEKKGVFEHYIEEIELMERRT